MSNKSLDDKDMKGFTLLPDEAGGHDYAEDNHRGPVILVLAICVLLVFGVVVWNAYKQGVRNNKDEALPQLTSDGPFKSHAANPGGRASFQTDRDVLNQLDGEKSDDTIAPAIVREEPVPLQPEEVKANDDMGLRSTKTERTVEPAFGDPEINTNTLGEKGAPVPLRKSGSSQTRQLDSPPETTSAQTPPVAAKRPEPVVTAEPEKPIIKPQAKPKPTAPVQIYDPVFSKNGNFVVQLAAVKSESAIDGIWKKARVTAPYLFTDAEQLVQVADLGAKGTWHRIRAGSFATRADANAFCDAFKKEGGDCIVMAK